MSWRQELLDEEARAWQALCRRFDAVREGDWLLPGASGEWSPKELLAHFAAWHAEAEHWLVQFAAGVEIRHLDPDRMSADFHERCKPLSLRDVQVMSGAARHRLREEIAAAPAELPERLRHALRMVTVFHYQRHGAELDSFLGRTA